MAEILVLSACSRAPHPAVQRIAILSFDNQTGDPSLDWIGTATPSIIAAQLTGLTDVAPIRSSTVAEAYLVHATTFVHGYFTGHESTLNYVIQLEDAARHKTTQVIKVDGSVLYSANVVAHKLAPGARPFTTMDGNAASAWGHGEFERAISIDPNFGQAWIAWAQMLATSKDSVHAIEIASKAIARPLPTKIENAQIKLLLATLQNDDAARQNALADLVKLMPADAGVIAQAAGSEMQARNFSAASDFYRSLTRVDPEEIAALNSLGYAEACAGNLEAARRDIEEYGRRQPAELTNALDSLGEAYFMNGKFSEAEKYFLQAHAGDARLAAGGDLLKAAYAHWLGGDLPGADALDQKYLQFRAGMHDPVLVWRQSVWLYATGRTDQAIAKLKTAPAQDAPLIEKQLAVWSAASEIPKDLAAVKSAYDRTSPTSDGEIRSIYAAALLAAGQKDQAMLLLNRWPLPTAGESLTESLMFPRFLDLRRQLNVK